YIVALGAYQIVRARDIQQDLRFSEKLVAALRADTQLASTQGPVLLIPSDAATERALQAAIGGYLYVVLQYALGQPRAAVVQDGGDTAQQADVRLLCSYDQNEDTVIIAPAQ
ncbi:MAG TPA: hypothetical protein VFO85_23020, partial [Vicinamibacteria bacterium]|nr:hypothetical protein [Vicinamibacteria bacterium]